MEKKYDLWSTQILLPQLNCSNGDESDSLKLKSTLNNNYFESMVSQIVNEELEYQSRNLNQNQIPCSDRHQGLIEKFEQTKLDSNHINRFNTFNGYNHAHQSVEAYQFETKPKVFDHDHVSSIL